MLTKDLIKPTVRSERIYPASVTRKKGDHAALAESLIAGVAACKSQDLLQLEENLSVFRDDARKTKSAFLKLLLDRCTLDEVDASIEERRWLAIAAAQQLRRTQNFAELAHYRSAVAESLQAELAALDQSLFSDLPAYRRILSFDAPTSDDLLNEYNIAQVQGLLIRAKSLKLELKGNPIELLRPLFRFLKFQQLLWEQDADDPFTLLLSGPLSIFDGQQGYGVKFALIFPALLQMKTFRLEATIPHRAKELLLLLDQSCGIRSSYKDLNAFTPPELLNSVKAFNLEDSQYEAVLETEPLHLGGKQTLLPDLALQRKNTEKNTGKNSELPRIDLELFHRWHHHQLTQRLHFLDSGASVPAGLKIGVSQDVAKKKELKAVLEASPWFQRNGFVFRSYPTLKQLLALTRANH